MRLPRPVPLSTLALFSLCRDLCRTASSFPPTPSCSKFTPGGVLPRTFPSPYRRHVPTDPPRPDDFLLLPAPPIPAAPQLPCNTPHSPMGCVPAPQVRRPSTGTFSQLSAGLPAAQGQINMSRLSSGNSDKTWSSALQMWQLCGVRTPCHIQTMTWDTRNCTYMSHLWHSRVLVLSAMRSSALTHSHPQATLACIRNRRISRWPGLSFPLPLQPIFCLVLGLSSTRSTAVLPASPLDYPSPILPGATRPSWWAHRNVPVPR